MALRNAFADLALDATVGAVRDLLTSILGRLPAAVDADGGLPVHLENTALPLPAGASTEPTLSALLTAIVRGIATLARPEYLDPVNNALRVNLFNAGTAGGTIGAVSAVSSVTNLAGLGSILSDPKLTLLFAQERALWYSAVRSKVS